MTYRSQRCSKSNAPDLLWVSPVLVLCHRVTELKHAVIESNWKQSEQNPMSDSLCSLKSLSNVPSVALERSIYTVGQHGAFRE